jgi:adenine-specific DNA-methyltransferase
MPIRYMGTKKSLAPDVRRAIGSLHPSGRVADLFSGVGSVSAELAPDFPVLANDVLKFAAAILRARFTEYERTSATDVARRLLPRFIKAHGVLSDDFDHRIKTESIAATSQAALLAYMSEAPHVGSSPEWQSLAEQASSSRGVGHYRLATLYFSGGYFSTSQAIELDSIRYAIDGLAKDSNRDWLLGAWIAAAAALINAPGHTAQYLKPSSESAYTRLRRQWRRSVWDSFIGKLDSLERSGDRRWRTANTVTEKDALDLVGSLPERGVDVVYADPPYTRDQYSRFYHVYETLFRYDYPDSTGAGRYRSDRFVTPFSHASRAKNVFEDFFGSVASTGLAMVLSYPDNGLVEQGGVRVEDILIKEFSSVERRTIDHIHSTLGASTGARRIAAKENLYVCIP